MGCKPILLIVKEVWLCRASREILPSCLRGKPPLEESENRKFLLKPMIMISSKTLKMPKHRMIGKKRLRNRRHIDDLPEQYLIGRCMGMHLCL